MARYYDTMQLLVDTVELIPKPMLCMIPNFITNAASNEANEIGLNY